MKQRKQRLESKPSQSVAGGASRSAAGEASRFAADGASRLSNIRVLNSAPSKIPAGAVTLFPSRFVCDSGLEGLNPEPIAMRFLNKSTRALINMKNELGYGAQAMAVASMDTPSYMIDEYIDMTEEVASRDDIYRKACFNAPPDDLFNKMLDDFRIVVEGRFADKIIDRLGHGYENAEGVLVLNARNPLFEEISLTPVEPKTADESDSSDPFAGGVKDVLISHATFSLRYQIPFTTLEKQFPDLSQSGELPRQGIRKCEVLRLVGTECGRIEFHLRDSDDNEIKLEAVTIWCI